MRVIRENGGGSAEQDEAQGRDLQSKAVGKKIRMPSMTRWVRKLKTNEETWRNKLNNKHTRA